MPKIGNVNVIPANVITNRRISVFHCYETPTKEAVKFHIP
jgi:hypothetical protein